jgi:D-tagatose-1,6-bisphosphate aldolase subunit GatZ/KbaZ
MQIEVTTTDGLRETLNVHRSAFKRRKLLPAWERVIAAVVQPGVEFGDDTVAGYNPTKAAGLSRFIRQQEGIVFEAHSTDYQSEEALTQLVRDHFAILKVGPELTFMMREAVFGLARIEEEWIPEGRRSNLRAIIERVMLEHPENWEAYYHGDNDAVRVARAFSFSDRIRYYWRDSAVSAALDALLDNLRTCPAPWPLVRQYLPEQATAIRVGSIANEPRAMIRHKIQGILSRYARSCGLVPQA